MTAHPRLDAMTYTVEQSANLLGVDRNLAYRVIRQDDALAGIPVIRIAGEIRIPRKRLDALLGLALATDGSRHVDETRLDPMEHGQEQ